MAIKVVDSLFSKIPYQFGVSKASQAYIAEQLLMEDKTAGNVIPGTSSVSTLNCLGVGVKSYTEGSSAATIKYIPLVTNSVFVIADCTNATAANQLHKDHLMTDSQNVNNTSTTSTAKEGVFHATALSGSQKLYGHFIRIGQVVS